jgi:adenylyl-sulfate kinase
MGIVIWFTGLSGSGKSTIAAELGKKLSSLGKTSLLLDGDVVRSTITKNLGFAREDIRENNRLIANLAKDRSKEYDFILVPVISPYREDRQMARSIVGHPNFIELFINAPLEECIRRDVKGLYKKALSGEIKDFIGIAESNPYQPPLSPDIEIKTNQLNLVQSTDQILKKLNIDRLLD